MLRGLVLLSFSFTLFVVIGLEGRSQEKDKKKQTGTLVGELKSTKASPNGKNQQIEVLAPGEEKARKYFVQYDPKVKGPMPEVLKAVRAAKVGDRVQFDWINTGEGLAITKFEILKKADEKKK